MASRLTRRSVTPGAYLRAADADVPAATRLALVTGVRLYREGLARLLAERVECHAVDASLPEEALVSCIGDVHPDVVLADIATIRTGRLRRCIGGARLVAFAVAESEEELLACVEMGVAGFVGRDASVEELLLAVDGARRGELHCSPRAAGLLFGRLAALARTVAPQGSRLTSRQQEILLLLDRGMTNKQIAGRLALRESTVKNHVHGLLERLNVRHRWEAMAAARRAPLRRLAPLES